LTYAGKALGRWGSAAEGSRSARECGDAVALQRRLVRVAVVWLLIDVCRSTALATRRYDHPRSAAHRRGTVARMVAADTRSAYLDDHGAPHPDMWSAVTTAGLVLWCTALGTVHTAGLLSAVVV